MANQGPSGCPVKRKRTTRKLGPIAEDDDLALDTAMFEDMSEGDTRRKVLVPVRLEEEVAPAMTEPEPEYNVDPSNDNLIQTSCHSQSKRQWFYMKEFVARVDGILQAMQAREALPASGVCTECPDSVGKWRCKDCMDGKLLCRCCMRRTHWGNPFHRAERWTGTYFRKAALWEVGVYISLKHQDASTICPNLQWQHQILNMYQKSKDEADQLQNPPSSSEPFPDPDPQTFERMAEPDPDVEMEDVQDAATIRALDQMLDGKDPDDFMEEDDVDEEETDADLQDTDAGAAGFTTYMPNGNDVPDPGTGTPIVPERDALNNGYVRVVHTNGIHHIALVSCTCRGKEKTITDLIYSGMLPTSFVRVRTLFTTALLDHFRYCNLELRTSAYQFFQVLRRFTMPMAPSKVVNLYHELRRLSRLWHWVKKLRWAGYGQQPGQPIDPQPGELGYLCPACPQDGINLPENWTEDPNPWVFRRVFTGDGNFTADHVRQKAPANDIWLYDGLGMTARRVEYEEFLVSAWDRATVRTRNPERARAG
jgi:hypothetical protein